MNQLRVDIMLIRAKRKADERYRRHVESFYGVNNGNNESTIRRRVDEDSREGVRGSEQVS